MFEDQRFKTVILGTSTIAADYRSVFNIIRAFMSNDIVSYLDRLNDVHKATNAGVTLYNVQSKLEKCLDKLPTEYSMIVSKYDNVSSCDLTQFNSFKKDCRNYFERMLQKPCEAGPSSNVVQDTGEIRKLVMNEVVNAIREVNYNKRKSEGFDNTCFNCGSRDHYIKDCDKEILKCGICFRNGHKSNDCPKRRSDYGKGNRKGKGYGKERKW